MDNEPLFISDDFGGIGHEDALMREACSSISAIRSNYVGNKRRLLSSIWETVTSNDIKSETITDAFGGSGSVSALFASMGKQVKYNDLLLTSCVQAACLLSEKNRLLTDDEWKALILDPNGEKNSTLVRTHYAEKFFTDNEALFLDRYLGNLKAMFPLSKDGLIYDCTRTPFENGKMKAIQAACAFIGHINSVCFIGGRYYNGQTIAKRDHRLEHAKNDGIELHHSFMESVLKIPKISYPRGSSSWVYNFDVVELLSKKVPSGDLLYLDPPYGGDSSDYASLYRFIEECITGVRYEDDTVKVSKFSKFKNNKVYSELFKEVLAAADGYNTWLISFNQTSFASLEEITNLIEEFGRTVDVKSVSISYKYRKKRRTIVLGKQVTGSDGETRRTMHMINGTDDELLLLARK